MCEEMLGASYFVLVVYRISDLICDLYCLSHFEDPVQKYIMIVTCVFGIPLNLWYLYRAIMIACRMMFRISPIGRMRSSDNILRELNFHVIEVIVNIFQTFLGGTMTWSDFEKGCFHRMSAELAYCCCGGAVLHLLCFLKNVAGRHGEDQQGDRKIVNVIGLGGSLISAIIGFFSIAAIFGLRTCVGS